MFHSLLIGLARRYSHSAVELFDLADVAGLIDLCAGTVEKLTSREMLLRV